MKVVFMTRDGLQVTADAPADEDHSHIDRPLMGHWDLSGTPVKTPIMETRKYQKTGFLLDGIPVFIEIA